MMTSFKDMGDHFLVNGTKMWISNAPNADMALVWAKNEEGRIHGLIIERGMEGFSTPEIHGKCSLRASCTGELVLNNVKVPKSNVLPGKSGLGAPLMCLDSGRYGIAWGVIGAAMECYDVARNYAAQRIQFEKPIASFQSVQKKLAEMLTEITKAQLLNWRLGKLMDEGRAKQFRSLWPREMPLKPLWILPERPDKFWVLWE
jgi:glutaryl-CoA dehydrogenase